MGILIYRCSKDTSVCNTKEIINNFTTLDVTVKKTQVSGDKAVKETHLNNSLVNNSAGSSIGEYNSGYLDHSNINRTQNDGDIIISTNGNARSLFNNSNNNNNFSCVTYTGKKSPYSINNHSKRNYSKFTEDGKEVNPEYLILGKLKRRKTFNFEIIYEMSNEDIKENELEINNDNYNKKVTIDEGSYDLLNKNNLGNNNNNKDSYLSNKGKLHGSSQDILNIGNGIEKEKNNVVRSHFKNIQIISSRRNIKKSYNNNINNNNNRDTKSNSNQKVNNNKKGNSKSKSSLDNKNRNDPNKKIKRKPNSNSKDNKNLKICKTINSKRYESNRSKDDNKSKKARSAKTKSNHSKDNSENYNKRSDKFNISIINCNSCIKEKDYQQSIKNEYCEKFTNCSKGTSITGTNYNSSNIMETNDRDKIKKNIKINQQESIRKKYKRSSFSVKGDGKDNKKKSNDSCFKKSHFSNQNNNNNNNNN